MLRIKLRGTPDGPAQAAPGDSQSFAVLADRLTLDSGCVSLWHTDEVVFCCPVAALASIAFEVLGDPRLASSLEPVDAHPPVVHPRLAHPQGSYPHVAHAQVSHAPVAGSGQPGDPYLEAHRDLASANTRWTAQDERRLVELHEAGVSIEVLARTFGRRKGAVRARLFKLRRALDAGPDSPTA